ncbi:phosphoribosyltransferase [Streptomyces chartreusis]
MEEEPGRGERGGHHDRRVNPKCKGKLKGKTVIVFDDFTTEGKSIEWARTLLTSANAAQVIAPTIGKYGASRHTAYQLRQGTRIDPYQVSYHLAATNFVTTPVTGAAGPGRDDALKATMSHFIAAAQNAE